MTEFYNLPRFHFKSNKKEQHKSVALSIRD